MFSLLYGLCSASLAGPDLGVAATGEVPIAPAARAAVNVRIEAPRPEPAYLYRRPFASEAEARGFLAELATRAPGDDLLYVAVDPDRDGVPDLLEASVTVRAAALGPEVAVARGAVHVDSNRDAVVDRVAWTDQLARHLVETVARR